MNRARTIVLAAAAAALAGCPLPQPLPDYPPGTVTPPRILVDDIRVNGAVTALSVIPVPAGCTGAAPAFALDVNVLDTNNIEQVDARWFIDYEPVQGKSAPQQQDQVIPDDDPLLLVRKVPTFTFLPYEPDGPPAAGTVRVVELVVSNGFFVPPQDAPIPWRSPASATTQFETQLYRWVFKAVAGAEGCPAP